MHNHKYYGFGQYLKVNSTTLQLINHYIKRRLVLSLNFIYSSS